MSIEHCVMFYKGVYRSFQKSVLWWLKTQILMKWKEKTNILCLP